MRRDSIPTGDYNLAEVAEASLESWNLTALGPRGSVHLSACGPVDRTGQSSSGPPPGAVDPVGRSGSRLKLPKLRVGPKRASNQLSTFAENLRRTSD